MRNPFKEILENEQIPEIIRKKVIDDIDLINLSLDMADLFLVKSPDVLFSFLSDTKKTEDDLDDLSDTDTDPTPNPYE